MACAAMERIWPAGGRPAALATCRATSELPSWARISVSVTGMLVWVAMAADHDWRPSAWADYRTPVSGSHSEACRALYAACAGVCLRCCRGHKRKSFTIDISSSRC